MSARLITIKVSHYCEKARWALERAGIAYEEEPHVPVFHVLVARRTSGRRTVPVLVVDGQVLGDSSDILAWIDQRLPEAQRLYPADGALRAEVEALEDRFDEALGPHVRRMAYFHLLPHKQLVVPLLGAGVRSRREQWGLRLGYPLLAGVMRRAMKITPEGAARSQLRVEQVWSEVEARLADGRRYLCGDRFSAADLTFAALAAPAVCPPEYGGPLPPLGEVPAPLRELSERLQATPAGRFALRLYREERAAR